MWAPNKNLRNDGDTRFGKYTGFIFHIKWYKIANSTLNGLTRALYYYFFEGVIPELKIRSDQIDKWFKRFEEKIEEK